MDKPTQIGRSGSSTDSTKEQKPVQLDYVDEPAARDLGWELFIAARAMLACQRHLGVVPRDQWRDLVLASAPQVSAPRLAWLWNSLAREPQLRELVRLAWGEAIEVLPAGSRFFFDVQNAVPDKVWAITAESLRLRCGKMGNSEACDVHTHLFVHQQYLTEHDEAEHGAWREREAVAFGVEPTRIHCDREFAVIEVESLNEAFTRVRRRLEPRRRSAGGSIYRHAYWEYCGDARVKWENRNQKRLTRLDQLRDAADLGVVGNPCSDSWAQRQHECPTGVTFSDGTICSKSARKSPPF